MLSSAFHIETEVPFSSTSTSISTPSTSIQYVLNFPGPIMSKTKRQYKKINYGTFTSDKVLEIYEKRTKKRKISQRRKKK